MQNLMPKAGQRPEQVAYDYCIKNGYDYNALNQAASQVRGSYKMSGIPTSPGNNKVQQYKKISTSNKTLPKSRKNKTPSYLQGTQSSKTKTKQSNENSMNTTQSIGLGLGRGNSSTLNMKKMKNPYTESQGEILNYGERLYHKCQKLQEKKEEKLQKIKDQIEEQEKQNNSFKPKINKMSYKAMSNRFNNKLAYNDEDNIIFYRDYVNSKLEDLRQKYPIDSTSYTFTPKICKKSVSMLKMKKQNPTPRYEQLYEKYKQRQVKIDDLDRKVYDPDIMFKPKINNNYKCDYNNLNFDQRRDLFMSKSVEKKKILKEQLESSMDERTGQRLFHPEVNDDYDYARPDENIDIFESLYNSFLKNRQKKINDAEQIYKKEKNCFNTSHVNLGSKDIIEEKKNKIFTNIFKILDSDRDDIITKLSVNDKALPKNIQKIFEPIITELKDENETLNQKEFITACQHLFSMLSYNEKREILEFGRENKRQDYYENCTFKPKINYYYSNNDETPAYINDSSLRSQNETNK